MTPSESMGGDVGKPAEMAIDLAASVEDVRTIYSGVASRRAGTAAMMWQVPSLSLAAQTFLLGLITDPDRDVGVRLIAVILGLILGMGALQVYRRHRYLEVSDSRLLAAIEKRRGWEILGSVYPNSRAAERAEALQVKSDVLSRLPSSLVWTGLQLLFVGVDLAALGWLLVNLQVN